MVRSLGGPAGPAHTALFVLSLCLANLFGTAVITSIAIVCAEVTSPMSI